MDIAERRWRPEAVDAHCACRGESFDAVPRRMIEVEGEAQRRIQRTEQELEHAVVPRALHLHADRPEPVAERTHAGLEDVERAQPVAGQLRRELEAVASLGGPAFELLLTGDPVAGRVELDRREPAA